MWQSEILARENTALRLRLKDVEDVEPGNFREFKKRERSSRRKGKESLTLKELKKKLTILAFVAAAAAIAIIYLVIESTLVAQGGAEVVVQQDNVSTKQMFMEAYTLDYDNGEALVDKPSTDYTKWTGNISIDTTIFKPEMVEMSKKAYAVAASVFSQEHSTRTNHVAYTTIGQTFYEQLDPLIPLAMMNSEWGGQTTLEYCASPIMAFRGNGNNSATVMGFDPFTVTKDQYDAYGVRGSVGSNDTSGPLQITPATMVKKQIEDDSLSDATCRAIYDRYNPLAACEYLWHRSWNLAFGKKDAGSERVLFPDYQVTDPYKAIVLLGDVNLSGSGTLFLDGRQQGKITSVYLWKRDANKAMPGFLDYIDEITNPENTAIMQAFADSIVQTRIAEMKAGNYSGNFQLSSDDAKKLRQQMVPDVTLFTEPNLSDGRSVQSLADGSNAFGVRQTLEYPIKNIVQYMMLRWFYTSGTPVTATAGSTTGGA